jgi:hypothetical protein
VLLLTLGAVALMERAPFERQRRQTNKSAA